MNDFPTPHGDKLQALLVNNKLPQEDRHRVEQAIEHYEKWLRELDAAQGTDPGAMVQMVASLNSYKRYVEMDLIFDSDADFLYRQKGQLKIDNTIIEEFLPRLVATSLVEQVQDYTLTFGPTTCFSGLRFESSLSNPQPGGGLRLREKDHDFAISRKLFVRTSHQPDFDEQSTAETHIAYVAAECKTNLDKTMFQEAAATALDVKAVVPGARYYLLCEWLDMTPVSTSTTAIDEILILRKARRLPAHVRAQFSTAAGRKQHRTMLAEFLESNPLSDQMFGRFVNHVRKMIGIEKEEDVLAQGYF